MKVHLVLSYDRAGQCRVLSPVYTKRESADQRAHDENNRKSKSHSYHVISKSLKGKIK